LLIGRLHDMPALGRGLLILVGLSAGIGFCLKPFLVAVPFAAELLHLLLSRNLRVILRAEIVTMASTVLIYVLLVLAVAPAYFEYALPLIRAVYWAYDDSGYLILARFKEAVLPAAYALAIAIVSLSFNRVHALLLAGISGFSISYWVQNKGFPYHAYPILGASYTLLAYSVIHAVRAFLRTSWVTLMPVRILIASLVLLVAVPVLRAPFLYASEWYEAAERHQGRLGRLRQGVIDRLQTLGIRPTDSIYAFSTHPNPGFPTVNYLGVQWAGRAVAQFVIPAYVRKSEVTDPAMREAIDRATAIQVDVVIADLTRHRPAYIMVESKQRRLGLAYRRFDDIAFYCGYAEFARLWNCYEEIGPVGDIRLFKLRHGCAADPHQEAAG
jgi:hypothetical protein